MRLDDVHGKEGGGKARPRRYWPLVVRWSDRRSGVAQVDVQKAVATQLANIEKKTGKSLPELKALIAARGLVQHAQVRDMLMSDLGLGHGDANTLTHVALNPASEPGAEGDGDIGAELDRLYVGARSGLRPLHEAVMARLATFGDFGIAPKKTYLSLRRKKQFATLGPASKTRFEVGLNMKGIPATARLLALPPGGMCQYKVNLADPKDVDPELLAWIRTAYDGAG